MSFPYVISIFIVVVEEGIAVHSIKPQAWCLSITVISDDEDQGDEAITE